MVLLFDINTFIVAHPWIVYPVFGAIVVPLIQIKKLGLKKLREGKHPFQAIFAMVIYGIIVGLFMAWMVTLIFPHEASP